MRIQGLSFDNHLHVVLLNQSIDIVTLRNMACEADVYIRDAQFVFRSGNDKLNPNRPYLILRGECTGLHLATPEGSDEDRLLPYNANYVAFTGENRLTLYFFYEFTDEELSEMVLKGMYHPDFKCPDIFFNNNFSLPVVCDFDIMRPMACENCKSKDTCGFTASEIRNRKVCTFGNDSKDVPLFFTNIHDRGNIMITAESSGYTLGVYFEKCVEHQFDDIEDDYMRVVDGLDTIYQDKIKEEEIVEQPQTVEKKPDLALIAQYREMMEGAGKDSYQDLVNGIKNEIAEKAAQREENRRSSEVERLKSVIDSMQQDNRERWSKEQHTETALNMEDSTPSDGKISDMDKRNATLENTSAETVLNMEDSTPSDGKLNADLEDTSVSAETVLNMEDSTPSDGKISDMDKRNATLDNTPAETVLNMEDSTPADGEITDIDKHNETLEDAPASTINDGPTVDEILSKYASKPVSVDTPAPDVKTDGQPGADVVEMMRSASNNVEFRRAPVVSSDRPNHKVVLGKRPPRAPKISIDKKPEVQPKPTEQPKPVEQPKPATSPKTVASPRPEAGAMHNIGWRSKFIDNSLQDDDEDILDISDAL